MTKPVRWYASDSIMGELGSKCHLICDALEPIVTIRSKRSHSLMQSQACRESEDDHAIVLIV
jgi:hypothetical protein